MSIVAQQNFVAKLSKSIVTVDVPINGISPEGQTAVRRLLYSLWRETSAPDSPTPPAWALPDDWDWSWKVNGKGEYVGTFPKRVAKYLYQKYGAKLSQEALSKLGSVAADHVFRRNTFYLDFTQEFDWKDGDFGDSGSCFWGGRASARDMLRDNGAYAVRFYEDERGRTGFARAWVAPHPHLSAWVIFNGYGLDTLAIARIVAQHWGAYYKRVSLENNGATDGQLWINGGAGYLVGSHDDVEGQESVDLGWEDEDSVYATCDNCHEVIEDEDDAHDGPNGATICESCHEDVTRCDHCEDCFWSDDTRYVPSTDKDVCNSCLDDLYHTCSCCDEYFLSDDLTEGEDGEQYCDSCHGHTHEQCAECGDWFLCGSLADGLCQNCTEEDEEEGDC